MHHPILPSRRLFAVLTLGTALFLASPVDSRAQEEVHIFVDSTAQIIRGFGANNIVGWRPDMTDAEIETAFGMGEGQLGFSILRVRIPPAENQWNINLRTASRAHEMGVTLIASPWSPPASMKTNNNLVSGRLRDDMYDDYAAYLDDFNTYMAENGAPLYGLSVQNEPDVEVTYESCDWSPEEMTRFVRENAPSIGTRVIAPESFQFRRVMSDPILNDPVAVENVDIIGGHIYGGGLFSYPLAEEKGKEVWMTEHLDTDYSMEAVMGTAVEIQNVMRAGMSAYIWWYIVRFYGPISDGEEGGYEKGEVTKRGHVMAQFSRFIRPGAVRVHTSLLRASTGVTVTAYRDGASLVVVAVNDAPAVRDVQFSVADATLGTASRYVTDETQDMQRLEDLPASGSQFVASLSAKSVNTFVFDYAPLSSENPDDARPSHELLQNYPNPVGASTTIAYRLSRTDHVKLAVFDLLGREISSLVDARVPQGTHRVDFHTGRLPAGVYLYQLRAGGRVQTRRMTVVR